MQASNLALAGHQGAVNAVLFHGDCAVSAGEDKTIKVWDQANREQQTECPASILSLCTLDTRLISGGKDNTLQVWRFPSMEKVTTVSQESWVTALDVHGNKVLSGGFDKNVVLWDLENGERLQTLKGHGNTVKQVIFRNASVAVTASWDQTVKLWDLRTGACTNTLLGHSEGVYALSLHPSGDQIFSGSADKTIKLWDLRNGKCCGTIKRYEGRVFALAAHQNGQDVVSGSHTSQIQAWNFQQGRPIARELKGHQGGVRALGILKNKLISGSVQGEVRLWDLTSLITQAAASPQPLPSLTPTEENADVNPPRIKTGEKGRYLILQGHKSLLKTIAIHPQEPYLISADSRGVIKVWDISYEKANQLYTSPEADSSQKTFGGNQEVEKVGFLRQGKKAYAITGNVLQIWDWMEGHPLQESPVKGKILCSDQCGGMIALGTTEGELYLYDGNQKYAFNTALGLLSKKQPLIALAFHSNGQELFTLNSEAKLKIWDVAKKKELHAYKLFDVTLTDIPAALFLHQETETVVVALGSQVFLYRKEGMQLEKSIDCEAIGGVHLNAQGVLAVGAGDTLSLYDLVKKESVEPRKICQPVERQNQQIKMKRVLTSLTLGEAREVLAYGDNCGYITVHRLGESKQEAFIDPLIQKVAKESITIKEEVAEGKFGRVFFGEWNYTPVAVKQLKTAGLNDEEVWKAKRAFIREINIMGNLRSPYVAQLYAVCPEADQLVMEWAVNGTLYELLHNPAKTVLWPQRYQLALNVAKGLNYLHLLRILHRDLKSDNILLDKEFKAKLTDFGLSYATATKRTHVSSVKGAGRWLAPEILWARRDLDGALYSVKSDVYALAIVLSEVFTRRKPFYHITNEWAVPDAVQKGERPQLDDRPEIPQELVSLMKRSWVTDREKRLSAEEVIKGLVEVEKNHPDPEVVRQKPVPTRLKPMAPVSLTVAAATATSAAAVSPVVMPALKEQVEPVSLIAPVVMKPTAVVKKPSIAFGAEDWKRYYGDVGVEPPLPSDIDAILNGECPFWSGKKVYETHLLVLIPEKVDGNPLTLDSLGEMIEKPKEGHATKYTLNTAKEEQGNKTGPRGYWVLMTRNVLPESRDKKFSEQKRLVGEYRGYEVPKLVEAATCVLMEHVKTGTNLYGGVPWTFTRVQEQTTGYQWAIGAFSPLGLVITHFLDGEYFGVGAARKL